MVLLVSSRPRTFLKLLVGTMSSDLPGPNKEGGEETVVETSRLN